MRDKKTEAMLAPLLPHFDRVILTRAESRRALTEVDLARQVGDTPVPTETATGIGPALERARELAGPAGEVVIAGSIYLLGEAIVELGAGRPEGPFDTASLETLRVDEPAVSRP